ncbi:hypothetical protein [Microbacterium sp. NPDC058389]|uniref:hypothetical protein n=1 Tax=Microbacterium sp. NPDC058389 TaxID=3346475 RepID=UPI003664AC5D
MRAMLKKLAPLAALLVVLTACAPQPRAANPKPTSSATQSAAPSPTPTATGAATGELPEACAAYEPTPLDPADGGAIGAAAETAQLGEDVRLFQIQVIDSTAEPGMYEAVARVCSSPLTRDQLVDAGTAIGAAVYATASAPTLATLAVEAWEPGDKYLREGETIVAHDFQSYLWDNTNGAIDAAWE